MPFDLERTPDASDWPFAPGRFAAIVVTNYLYRPLLPKLAEALRPDGVLVYETFARGNERFGKPSNPAFLLEEGELLKLPLSVIAYESGYTAVPQPALVQRLAACGPAFPRAQAVLGPESGQE
jgi:SAM-dependent methyltransferase